MTRSNNQPFVIGITGTIGTGKSTVGEILTRHNVPVIDSDKIVHDLLARDQAIIKSIIEKFGDDIAITSEDGKTIDRQTLGKLIFADPKARRQLEAIVHPATIMECRRLVANHKEQTLVAILVPLLFEAGLESEYDEIWTIYADDATLKQRISKRDGLSQNDIEQRIAAQLPQKEKIKRSRQVIDNSGTKDQTEKQVVKLIEKLSQKPGA